MLAAAAVQHADRWRTVTTPGSERAVADPSLASEVHFLSLERVWDRVVRSPPPTTTREGAVEMLDDVWHSRDLPVLREVARRADVKPRGLRVTLQEVEEATGLSRQDVQTAGLWLLDAGLVQVDVRGTSLVAAFTGITPAARTRVGLWPSPEAAADRLITVLKEAVEQAPTLEERTRRQKILTGVVESGRDFAVSLAAGVLTGQLGG